MIRWWRELSSATRQRLALTVSAVVAVALVMAVWRYTSVSQLGAVLRAVSPAWIGASIACFLLYQWFRMRRTALLLDLPPTGRLFGTMCIQGGANDLIFPVGTGDAALVYLLKRWHHAGYAQGLASLVTARVVDLGLFAGLFAALLLVSRDSLPTMLRAIMITLAAVLFAASLGLWAILRVGGWSKRRWRADPPHSARLARAALAIQRLKTELHTVHTRRIYAPLLFHSVAMWVAMYLSYLALLRSLDAPLSAGQVLLLYVLVFPVDLTPVKGPANIGTHEGVWFVALRVLGVESGSAAALSFATHSVILATLVTSIAVGTAWFALPTAVRDTER